MTEQKNPKFLQSLQNAQRDTTNLAIRYRLECSISYRITHVVVFLLLCRVLKGVPNTPVFDVISRDKENECAVFVQWELSSSDCPVLFHTISYKRQGENEWTRLNITGKNTNSQKIETECSTEYEFQVLAWNEVGPSPITTKTYTTKADAVKNNKGGI